MLVIALSAPAGFPSAMAALAPPRLLADCTSPPMRDAAAVARHLQPMLSDLSYELLVALLLDDGDRVVGEVTMRGTADSVDICPRRMFAEALAVDARAMILAHNHPHGDPTPSAADIAATRDCARIGMLLSVPLLDHLVFGHDRVTSFRGFGLL